MNGERHADTRIWQPLEFDEPAMQAPVFEAKGLTNVYGTGAVVVQALAGVDLVLLAANSSSCSHRRDDLLLINGFDDARLKMQAAC